MTDDLLQTAVLGVATALLGFELIVAARSWHDARSAGHGRHRTAPWLGPPEHGQLLLSQAFSIRGHIAARRPTVNALRRRYAVMGTDRYARQLRSAIGHVRPGRLGDVAASCPWCRVARLKGRGHCLECGRRLIAPALSAGA